ncbi:MAG TPA: dihydrofolate reductase [Thermoplasmata archaeon]|nr:dihydrofolate reductase [Thermoplasmata archaeon]
MTISLIAAVARNDVIGRDGQMPWDLPADLEYFRRVTMGRPVIVGRKTYEAIGQMLDGRRVFVLTRDEGFRCDDCTVVHDVVDALIYTGMIGGEVFVAGGAEVYEQFLPLAERLYITRIDADFGGDTRFPTVFWEDWREISREKGPRDERNLYDHWYIVYERKGAFGAKARGAKGKGRPGQRRPAKSGRPGTGARRNR